MDNLDKLWKPYIHGRILWTTLWTMWKSKSPFGSLYGPLRNIYGQLEGWTMKDFVWT
jgi:hypothetical protein